MSKTAPLILGIAALGGIGYMIMTGGSTGGSLTGGNTVYPVTPPSGGVEVPGNGGNSGGSGSTPTTITAEWKKRADISYSTDRTTCAVNGFKAKVYTESDRYAPGQVVRIAVLGKYFENSGDKDWWAYAGGANVNLTSWYGGKERVYTGIKVISDEDPSAVITVQNYGSYPQSPEATGGSAVVASGALTQSILDDVSSRSSSGGSAGKDKWGLAVYTFTAPSTPGRYTVEFKMGIDDTAASRCNPKSRDATFSFSVEPGVVFGAEASVTRNPSPITGGYRFTPIGSVQSNRIW
jgi:hypothetical protein